jgi:GT2 family glycosyltransferase
VKRVCIILLNWNNWPDTLECLESLFQMDYPDFKVVVCDNGSTDGSPDKIRAWAAGDLDILAERSAIESCGTPCVKPVAMVEYDREVAEQGGLDELVGGRLFLICNGSNLGFAGGNNVGLRYALRSSEIDYCWVLNNDTVVAVDALQRLVDRMSESPTPGICGSTILEYRHPERINALGGAIYSRWLGLAWHLGRGRKWPKEIGAGTIEKRMNYVVGASMFVSREFLLKVGLMEESYFLYFEELDWAMRARDLFPLVWAPESLVYHKVGGSIGTSSHPARKSWTSDFYTLRNRIRFTRQYCPYALPTVYLGLVGAIILRLLFGQWRRALMVARLMVRPEISFEDCCAA